MDDFAMKYRLGLGSFAFRYSIGNPQFLPPSPMSCLDFIRAARHLKYLGVQLCENLYYSELEDDKLRMVGEEARRLGMFVELGMNGLSEEALERHFVIARLVGAEVIRIVIGNRPISLEQTACLLDKASGILRNAVRQCRRQRVVLGIENHFDLTTADLVSLVKKVGESHIRMIYDATNALGFLERPEETFVKMRPYLIGCHIKDFRVEKVEGGYLIAGTTLGSGLMDVERTLSEVLSASDKISVILESYRRRDDKLTAEEVVSLERKQVEQDSIYLMNCLRKISAQNAVTNKVEE